MDIRDGLNVDYMMTLLFVLTLLVIMDIGWCVGGRRCRFSSLRFYSMKLSGVGWMSGSVIRHLAQTRKIEP